FGVPLITPAELRESPGGNVPLDRVQTIGAVPPVTLSVRGQLAPAVHAARGALEIDSAGLMVRLKLMVVFSNESAAVSATGKVPDAVGVPVMPVRLPVVGVSASPGGRPVA